MKILAIRGEGLASLRAPFEVNLASGALSQFGLFAITGPTGAGKSTLLDAVCLALYDKVPRLDNIEQRSSQVESSELRSNDPRTLLSRGAVEGWAEVDFEGNDRQAYRARWVARRARGKLSGKIQPTQLTLIKLSDKIPVARTKKEVLAAIEEKIALNYDQFRRSVFLAQGDFAAFLKADSRDRSELLERMTGTEIYSRISIHAHMRAVAERQQLELLTQQKNSLPTLDVEAAKSLQKQLKQQRNRVETCQVELQKTTERLNKTRQFSQLLTTEQQLTEKLQKWTQDWTATVDDRKRLKQWSEASELLQMWREYQRLLSQSQSLSTSIKEVDTQFEAASKKSKQLKIEHESYAERIQELEARTAKEAADLERAQTLDLQLKELKASQEGMQATEASLNTKLHETESKLCTVKKQLETTTQNCNRLATWLTQFRAKPNSDFGSLRTIEKDLWPDAQLAPKLEALFADQDALIQRQQSLNKKRGLLEEESAEKEKQLSSHLESDDSSSVEALLNASKQKQEAKERLQSLLACSVELEELKLQEAKSQSLANECRDQLQTLREKASHFHQQISKTEQLIAEQEALLTQRQLSVERAKLTDGQPCPLCGSETHPWKEGRDGEDFSLTSSSHLAELRHSLQQTTIEVTATTENIKAREEQLKQVQRDAERLQARKTDLSQRWNSDTAQDQREIGNQIALVSQQQQDIEQSLNSSLKREKSIAQLREHNQEIARKQKVASSEWNHTEKLLLENKEKVSTCVRIIEQRLLDLQARQAREKAEDELNQKLALSAKQQKKEFDSSREELLKRLASLRKQRANLLGGKTTSAYLEQKRSQQNRLNDRLKSSTQRLSECEKSEACLAREQELLHQSLQTCKKEQKELHTKVKQGLKRKQLSESDLSQLLELSPEWIQTRQTEIQALQEQGVVLRSRLDQSKLQKEAFSMTEDEVRAEAILVDEIKKQKKAVKQEEQVLRELSIQKLADEQNRRQVKELNARLKAKLEEFDLWEQLRQLIGSADGRKFRLFAQSLTFDVLISYANVYLRDFIPRYALQRTPKSHMDLQVIDREMADEVRSVHSLSGGESFLVSLALALGLSMLASETTPIHSLFIDEGFGALDEESLELALDALDDLQASGRQVGVISHIPGLIERIGVCIKVMPEGGGSSRVQISA